MQLTLRRLSSNKQIRANQCGSVLIEVLIAMLVATMFSAAILKMYVQTFSLSDQAQDQIMAASIAQECIDALRALPYNTVLNGSLGNSLHYATVCGSPGGDVLFPRPLLQDTSNYQYSAGGGVSVNGLRNRFQVVNNQVLVNVTQQSANTLLVQVTVNWLDNTGSHTYNTYTILVLNGLNS